MGLTLLSGARAAAPVPEPITAVYSVPVPQSDMALLSQLYGEQARYGGSKICVRQWYMVPGGPYALRMTLGQHSCYSVGSTRWCLLHALLWFEALRREGTI